MGCCRSGAADHIAATNAAVSFAPAPRPRAVAVRRNFPEMCVVRKGLGGGGVPRPQATGRCDLTSPPAQECFSVVTVPSRHRHLILFVASVPVEILLGGAVTVTATEKRR